MCGVFALLGKFDLTVLWGALLGTAFAIGNFFFLGLSLQKGLEMGDQMPQHMQATYRLRMLLFVICIALGALLPCFHLIATIIPLFLPRIAIYGMQLLGVYKPDKKPAKKGDDEP